MCMLPNFLSGSVLKAGEDGDIVNGLGGDIEHAMLEKTGMELPYQL